MRVDPINTAKMRNNKHFQFMTEFKDSVNKHEAIKPKIRTQFDEFLSLYQDEDTAYKKIIKSVITDEIQDADAYRDQVLNVVSEIVDTALKHRSENVIKAGKNLKTLLNTYGKVKILPMNEETAAIYNLLQELNSKYRTDAQLIHLTEWVTELQTTNNYFDKLIKDRLDESALKTNLILREVREKIDVSYKNLIEKINSLIVVEGETIYVEFVKYFNLIIDKYD